MSIASASSQLSCLFIARYFLLMSVLKRPLFTTWIEDCVTSQCPSDLGATEGLVDQFCALANTSVTLSWESTAYPPNTTSSTTSTSHSSPSTASTTLTTRTTSSTTAASTTTTTSKSGALHQGFGQGPGLWLGLWLGLSLGLGFGMNPVFDVIWSLAAVFGEIATWC
jgi:hypothetical protein